MNTRQSVLNCKSTHSSAKKKLIFLSLSTPVHHLEIITPNRVKAISRLASGGDDLLYNPIPPIPALSPINLCNDDEWLGWRNSPVTPFSFPPSTSHNLKHSRHWRQWSWCQSELQVVNYHSLSHLKHERKLNLFKSMLNYVAVSRLPVGYRHILAWIEWPMDCIKNPSHDECRWVHYSEEDFCSLHKKSGRAKVEKVLAKCCRKTNLTFLIFLPLPRTTR